MTVEWKKRPMNEKSICISSAYKKAYNKVIDDFVKRLKMSTENMFGQKYVDIRTVEEIAKQFSHDDTKQATIEEFAEWVFYYVDGYHFSSKEEMLAEWNKQLTR